MCPRAGGARHGNEGWRLFLFLWHDSERIHMLRKEDFVPDSLLPWKPIAPSSCSRFSLWAIFGLGPLPPPFDAAASRVSGKTVTETFPTPADCRKAQQEVSEFHRFQLLSQELFALNEKALVRIRN